MLQYGRLQCSCTMLSDEDVIYGNCWNQLLQLKL